MSTMKRIILTLIGATLAAAPPATAASASGPEPLRAVGVRGPLADELLSDERTVTRFAYPQRIHKIRTGPSKRSHAFARLRFYTEDRAPENYLVLRSRVGKNGRVWLQIRVPRRPNGSTGWVPRAAMRRLRTLTTSLEIDKRTLKAHLFKDGIKIWSSRVGIGAPGTPTPSGRFWIRERLDNLGGSAAYGPLAFGTSNYSRLSDWPGGGVVGIHGTNQPSLIPGRPSHGCVRVPNRKILELDQLMPVGTPVWIHN
jgi:hypothetical protein